MRACQPSRDGYVARDRVKVHYEVFGAGEPTVMLLPTWSIIHSRHWKLQVPDLARRHRVITFDGRGNGLSDRPAGPEAYRTAEFTADALAVMDATGTERAVLAGLSLGATWALELGALHPERVAGIIFIGPAVPLVETSPRRSTFTERLDTTDGWAKFNQHYWREHYREFIEFFMHQIFTEPHSTKPIEDAVAWGLETDPETLIATQLGVRVPGEVFWDAGRAEELARRLRCPVLVIHGDDDAIRPLADGARLAELSGGELVTIEGGGHAPHVDAGAAPPAPRAVHLLPDRAGPRPAGPGHRPRAAAAAARPGGRVAGPGPGHAGAGGGRRAAAPRLGAAGQRVGLHRVGVGRARPALLPGHPAHGRDPAGQLHGLPRRGGRSAP